MDGTRKVTNNMPSPQNWPTIELRILVHSQTDSLVFYQAGLDAPNWTAKVSDNGIAIKSEDWPHSENGQAIYTGEILQGPEVHPVKSAGVVNKEFVYRIGGTLGAYREEDNSAANPKNTGFPTGPANEKHMSPLEDMGRSFAVEKDINFKLVTSMPDGNDVHGKVEKTNASDTDPRLRKILILRTTNNPNAVRDHNVAQGLLRVIQRAMAAGVMIELYRQMAEISLYTFINNSLPKVRQHLYESLEKYTR